MCDATTLTDVAGIDGQMQRNTINHGLSDLANKNIELTSLCRKFR
jgi:hypothetical protein